MYHRNMDQTGGFSHENPRIGFEETSTIIRKNYCFLLDFPLHQFIELHKDSLLDGLTHHFSSVFHGSTAFVHAKSKWVSTSLARSQPCGRWRRHHLAMEEPDAVPRADAPGTMAKLMNITPMAHNYGLWWFLIYIYICILIAITKVVRWLKRS